ncbi:glycosyl transferase [Micromonospora sagamiensis]|uniref:6-pyruvoyl-tetrahydropterin synthase-like protein n=1 Tax=Micromonospora sagamiensis TaxID=47875 RepID=A0A562WK49_9ACTN|nr:6-pyruvoyl-tetrahydropterin synthase-like protein [Micromonospora sagamiensis]BCL16417.1 glycosyl transferase [Micromonospora sagamiensis]
MTGRVAARSVDARTLDGGPVDGTTADEEPTVVRAEADETDAPGALAGTTTADRRRRWPTWRRDLGVFGFFLLAAIWVTSQIWVDPAGRVASLYSSDPAQVQFFLAHSVRVVLHGEFPFYTEQFNYPDGVNLMANTAILALGIPMVPITLLFGPAVTFVVLVTLALAGTASTWYFVLSRHVVRTPLAALVGGWFCGFSPAMLSHANWHPNIISQWLLPFIVWRVLVITRSRRPVRDGVILALLVTWQAFINEEILLFTAMACGIFLLAVLAQRRDLWSSAWRPMAVALGVCTVVAGALLAYPLYIQFGGPMAYHGLSDAVRDYGNDIAAFVTPGSPTLGGNERANANLAPNYSEENAFFGWSLVLITIGIVLWLRREVVVRALAVTGAFYAVLSLGERISWWDRDLFTGPWEWLVHLPLLDAVVPTRFGMITTVVIGVLLAVAVERAWTTRPLAQHTRTLVGAGLVMALLPIAPMPLKVTSRPPVPDFITSDQWRRYVAAEQTLVPVPIPSMGNTHGMRWAASTNLDFKIPGGYFLAPRNGNTGDPGRFGGRPSGVGEILQQVATTGRTAKLTDRERRRSLDELRHWRAAIVVLPVDQKNVEPLRQTVEQLVGPARREQDVWLWDVRPITTRTD